MELLIALLTFFNVSYGVDGNTVKLGWSKEEAASIHYTDEYVTYMNQGGVDLYDAAGTPAITVVVDPPKE